MVEHLLVVEDVSSNTQFGVPMDATTYVVFHHQSQVRIFVILFLT